MRSPLTLEGEFVTTILMGISKGAGRFFSQLIEKSKDGEYDLGPNLEPHPGWKSCKHLVALNFGRGKTQYILRQDGTNAVYINPINEMGGVSPVPSDKAQWKSHYPNLFSYRVGDKVFLGGQNDTNGFFLQEILPMESLVKQLHLSKTRNGKIFMPRWVM